MAITYLDSFKYGVNAGITYNTYNDTTIPTKISVNTADSSDFSTQLGIRSAVVHETNPDTALPWTTAEVNNMTVGLKT